LFVLILLLMFSIMASEVLNLAMCEHHNVLVGRRWRLLHDLEAGESYHESQIWLFFVYYVTFKKWSIIIKRFFRKLYLLYYECLKNLSILNY
jgi:hypothetical protein